jgi:hypothetical protein
VRLRQVALPLGVAGVGLGQALEDTMLCPGLRPEKWPPAGQLEYWTDFHTVSPGSQPGEGHDRE